MNCNECGTLLHALVDGELDAGHASEVERHVATCTRCAAEKVFCSAPASTTMV